MFNFQNFSKANFTNILALIFILLTFIFDFLLLSIKFPLENRDLIIGIANILNSGGLIMILSYFFGSTKSSQEKDTTIKNLSKPEENTNN